MLARRFVLLSSPWTPTYVLRDEYINALAAGSVNGTAAEPGPGTRAVTDTENKISITSGRLAISGGKAAPGWGDPYIVYNGIARATGLAFSCVANFTTFQNAQIGFDNNATPSGLSRYLFNVGSAANVSVSDDAVTFIVVFTGSVSTDYTMAVIIRSAGAFYAIKGGAFSGWTLLWAGNGGVTTPLYPAVANYNGVFAYDNMTMVQLPVPWNSDYGIATQRLSGARTAGDVFIHEADCLIEFTATAIPSADQIEVWFRSPTVGTDGWRVTIDSTGALDLDEVVATIATQRGTAAGVIANGDRVVIVAVDEVIKVYDNGTLRITYSSAATQKTQTAGELETEGTDGSVSDIVTWPRTLSGSASYELARYIG